MSEEAEIVKVAVEGTEIYLRLAGTSIKDALKFLKFILSGAGGIAKYIVGSGDRKLDRELKTYKAEREKMEMEMIKARNNLAAGSMDIKEFIKIFGAEERTILQMPDSSMERFKQLAEKNGLTYSMLQDLDQTDGYVQVMIPNSQLDIWNEIEKQLQKEEMKKNKDEKEKTQKEMDETAKEKAEYTSEKKKMEKEGTDKTDPEHYNDVISSIKILENKEKYLKEQLENLDKNITREITLEDYMKTNPKAFDHTDLFNEMLENGIEPKGCEKISEFMKMPDGSISKYKNGNSIHPDGYIVNPDIPDMAIRREEISKDNKIAAYQYTVFETDKPLLNEMDFEVAVDNAINREEGESYYICSKDNPENYMEINSTEEVYEDRLFTNTEFKVYNNGIEQKCDEFSHGKFSHYSRKDGKNSSPEGEGHWENVKTEIKVKGGFGNKILIFEDKDSYLNYKKQYEDTKGEILNNNKIRFKAEAKTTDEEKIMFIRQINQIAKKKNPNYEPSDKWMVIGSMEELEKYREITKKNEALQKTKGELKEEFKENIGKEQSEQILNLAKVEIQNEKNVIEIPEDRLMMKREEGKKPRCYLRSDDNKYVIHLDPDKIKQDKSGKKILILGQGEHLDVIDRTSRKPSGQIHSQKDMSDFLGKDASAKDKPVKSQEKGGIKK